MHSFGECFTKLSSRKVVGMCIISSTESCYCLLEHMIETSTDSYKDLSKVTDKYIFKKDSFASVTHSRYDLSLL